MPPQRRVLAHRNRRALTVHTAGTSTPRTRAAPAAEKFYQPTRPPRLTTRPAGASDNVRTAHRHPQSSFPRNTRPPENGGLGLEQGGDRAPAPPLPPHSHPRPIDSLPGKCSTVDDVAAIRPDADTAATGPHSQTIRGLLGGACAGWRVRRTSVELNGALLADNPISCQRSIATVLINEASFEDLVNAHTQGAFIWRQLARAAPCPAERDERMARAVRGNGDEQPGLARAQQHIHREEERWRAWPVLVLALSKRSPTIARPGAGDDSARSTVRTTPCRMQVRGVLARPYGAAHYRELLAGW